MPTVQPPEKFAPLSLRNPFFRSFTPNKPLRGNFWTNQKSIFSGKSLRGVFQKVENRLCLIYEGIQSTKNPPFNTLLCSKFDICVLKDQNKH